MKQQRGALCVLTAATFAMMAVIPLCTSASSLIRDPDAESIVQRNAKLNEPIAASLSSDRPKSPVKAFLLSAAIPGTGEFYSGAKRGLLFVAAEVVFWTTYAVLHGQAEDVKENYINFVDSHIVFEEDSPVNSTETWTLEDYEHATQSDNWHYVYTESNGKPLDRVGKYYWDDLPEDLIGEPGDKPLSESQSQTRVEAYGKRDSMNNKFKQAKLFLGFVVLNHIVSAVDARIAATVYNNRFSEASAEISLYPTVSPLGYVGAYLTLSGSF